MSETDTTPLGVPAPDDASVDRALDATAATGTERANGAIDVDESTGDATAGSSTARAEPVVAVDAPKLTRRGRLRKWDRPPPPHDWRWYVSHVGRVLIAVGLLMFGFVAYQLWGTAIENAQAQNALENDFEELLASTADADTADAGDDALTPVDDVDETIDDATDTEPADPPSEPDTGDDVLTPVDDTVDEPPVETQPEVLPVDEQVIPLVENGDALARIEIPSIGVNDIVVAGVETGDLKRGPGHFPDTPLPGQLGNSAIAGHRTTYGQPFHDVDKLVVGDEIRVTTLTGEYVYRVTGQQIVSPSDYQVVATTDPTVANLTLTSCHPKWTAQQRIVIFSELDREASATVGAPVYNYGRDDFDETDTDSNTALPGEDATDDTDDAAATGATDDELAADDATDADDVSGSLSGSTTGDPDGDAGTVTVDEVVVEAPPAETGIADAFADGWFSDPGANLQVGLWGLILALIGVGAYLISRRLRRDWVGAMVGIVPFVVALYFFFQNVNRLLPPNL